MIYIISIKYYLNMTELMKNKLSELYSKIPNLKFISLDYAIRLYETEKRIHLFPENTKENTFYNNRYDYLSKYVSSKYKDYLTHMDFSSGSSYCYSTHDIRSDVYSEYQKFIEENKICKDYADLFDEIFKYEESNL